jgi:lysophospholipid acyltransferase (LPLAT)-like uncharacterized protein
VKLRSIFLYITKWLSKFQKKSHNFTVILAKLAVFFIRLAFRTTKWIVMGEHFPNQYHQTGRPFIVCLWHDRLMLAPRVWKWKKPLHVLASDHRDGRFIAKIVENFSMPAVYGSTGKGFAAAKKLIQLLRKGEYVAIIPDGPRGPRHKLYPGVIAIAKLAKADILTFSFCVKRYFRLSSWDRFIVVWPFNRGVMVWNKPVLYEDIKNISEAEAVQLVESRINEASREAHRILTDG